MFVWMLLEFLESVGLVKLRCRKCGERLKLLRSWDVMVVHFCKRPNSNEYRVVLNSVSGR